MSWDGGRAVMYGVGGYHLDTVGSSWEQAGQALAVLELETDFVLIMIHQRRPIAFGSPSLQAAVGAPRRGAKGIGLMMEVEIVTYVSFVARNQHYSFDVQSSTGDDLQLFSQPCNVLRSGNAAPLSPTQRTGSGAEVNEVTNPK